MIVLLGLCIADENIAVGGLGHWTGDPGSHSHRYDCFLLVIPGFSATPWTVHVVVS